MGWKLLLYCYILFNHCPPELLGVMSSTMSQITWKLLLRGAKQGRCMRLAGATLPGLANSAMALSATCVSFTKNICPMCLFCSVWESLLCPLTWFAPLSLLGKAWPSFPHYLPYSPSQHLLLLCSWPIDISRLIESPKECVSGKFVAQTRVISQQMLINQKWVFVHPPSPVGSK